MKLCNIIKNDVAAIGGWGINPFIPPLSTPLWLSEKTLSQEQGGPKSRTFVWGAETVRDFLHCCLITFCYMSIKDQSINQYSLFRRF